MDSGTLEILFSAAGALATAGWLCLAFLYRFRTIRFLLTSVVIPGMLSVLYVFLIARGWGSGGGFGSLAEVAALFESHTLLLAGWVHYLAFDLFIGTLIIYDAEDCGINHWLVVPIGFLTFMFGPAGLLAYILLKAVLKKQTVLNPKAG